MLCLRFSSRCLVLLLLLFLATNLTAAEYTFESNRHFQPTTVLQSCKDEVIHPILLPDFFTYVKQINAWEWAPYEKPCGYVHALCPSSLRIRGFFDKNDKATFAQVSYDMSFDVLIRNILLS